MPAAATKVWSDPAVLEPDPRRVDHDQRLCTRLLLSPSAAGFRLFAAVTFAHIFSRLLLLVERPLDRGRMVCERLGMKRWHRDFRHAFFVTLVILFAHNEDP
jgi:hypothetical protein